MSKEDQMIDELKKIRKLLEPKPAPPSPPKPKGMMNEFKVNHDNFHDVEMHMAKQAQPDKQDTEEIPFRQRLVFSPSAYDEVERMLLSERIVQIERRLDAIESKDKPLLILQPTPEQVERFGNGKGTPKGLK